MNWFNCYSSNNQLVESLFISVCSRVVGHGKGNGCGKGDMTSEQPGLECWRLEGAWVGGQTDQQTAERG